MIVFLHIRTPHDTYFLKTRSHPDIWARTSTCSINIGPHTQMCVLVISIMIRLLDCNSRLAPLGLSLFAIMSKVMVGDFMKEKVRLHKTLDKGVTH